MEKKLGVEIEFTGVSRDVVVGALENFFHSVAEQVESSAEDRYKYYRIEDMNGDTWLVVRDRSIKPQFYSKDTDYRFEVLNTENTELMCELVSPPLTSKSLPILFSVVDIIKALGGITNESCGIHVHVDMPDDINSCAMLLSKFIIEQDAIISKFNVRPERLVHYCKKYDYPDLVLTDCDFETVDGFINYLGDTILPKGETELKNLRYHALNMYSMRAHKTIEFRLFNSSLSRVDIATILDWVLHFMYTSEEYGAYIPVLGSILMNEMKAEV